MIKLEDLKSGTYISTKNKDGRLVLKILNMKYNILGGNEEQYICELIEGKLYTKDIQDYYTFTFLVLRNFEIAIDYMRDAKLKELGIV